jgi:hypothetical protein
VALPRVVAPRVAAPPRMVPARPLGLPLPRPLPLKK